MTRHAYVVELGLGLLLQRADLLDGHAVPLVDGAEQLAVEVEEQLVLSLQW